MQIARKNPSEREIDLLLAKARRGDAAAFGELYDIHVDQIYRHIYYRVSNTSDAEDLTQQVFIRAWQAIGRYRKESTPFAAWLMTISRNLIIDFYRGRKDKVSLDKDFEAASREPGPEQLAETGADRRELVTAITRLPEEFRQVIVMRFIEDYSYDKIAAAMNKSEGAIRVILHRALKKMRALMEEGNSKK